MLLAIHHRVGSFSERWISYCKSHSISYKLVNCYSPEIIQDLKECDALMWHWHHHDGKSHIFAKEIVKAVEEMGLQVFPSSKASWHFDDKIAQFYLFQALNMPHVKSYIFYDSKAALEWSKTTIFPKVFKLRNGAGSSNVRLVRNQHDASKLIRRAFSHGFAVLDRKSIFFDRFNKFRSHKTVVNFKNLVKGGLRIFISDSFERMSCREKGYIYFQDYLANNPHDTRIIVIDGRAFAIQRINRANDFRASGSGNIRYDYKQVPLDLVEISFSLAKAMKSECVAFDFIKDNEGTMKLVEMSFGFTIGVYDPCQGYWMSNLEWVEGSFNPQEWMVENVVKRVAMYKDELSFKL